MLWFKLSGAEEEILSVISCVVDAREVEGHLRRCTLGFKAADGAILTHSSEVSNLI